MIVGIRDEGGKKFKKQKREPVDRVLVSSTVRMCRGGEEMRAFAPHT